MDNLFFPYVKYVVLGRSFGEREGDSKNLSSNNFMKFQVLTNILNCNNQKD